MCTEKKKRNQYEFDKYKYDHVHLQLPKDKRVVVQVHAAARAESLNGFVNRAINETITRDNAVKAVTGVLMEADPDDSRKDDR